MGIWRKIAVLTSGVMLSLSLTGFNPASANWTEPNGGNGTESTLFTSTVPTQLWCTWYVKGVGDIALKPPVVDTIENETVYAEYEGETMLLSAVQQQQFFLAGWTESGEPTVEKRLDGSDEYDCDWYLNGMGITVDVVSSGTKFSASVPDGLDLAMSWSLTEYPMSVHHTAYTGLASNCVSWDLNTSGLQLDGVNQGGRAASTGPSSTSEYCVVDTSYQVSMPGGMTPSFAGQDYSFTGPTLKTKVLISLG